MDSEPELVILPITIGNEQILAIEVENKYGPSWGPFDPPLRLAADQLTKAIASMFGTAISGEKIHNAKIEFSIGAQLEDRSLRLFLARTTSPSLFKITVEVEPKQPSEVTG